MGDPRDELIERANGRIGKLVDGKWRLDALLGVGGMAVVYAATHRNGLRGAIKILHPEVALSSRVKSRFLREGYVANKVGHPGAVAVLDDDEAPDGTVFLVMELLDGQTLDVKYEQKTMGYADAASVADQILDVLRAAHDKGIVHRDLKPANLFLTREGMIKVLDFGIARLRELTSGNAPNSATTMHAMGTPGFMAPEQARGLWEEVDARTDLWAVGATLFTLVTGKEVHAGRTVNEQLLAGMTKPAPLIASVSPLVPPVVAEVIDRSLKFEQGDRYQSAAEMQAAVRDAFHALTGRRLAAAARLEILPSTPRLPVESFADATVLDSSPPGRLVERAMTTDGAAVPKGSAGAITPSMAPRPSRRRAAVYASIAVLAGVGATAVVRRLDAPPPFSSDRAGSASALAVAAPAASPAPASSTLSAPPTSSAPEGAEVSPAPTVTTVRAAEPGSTDKPAGKTADRPPAATPRARTAAPRAGAPSVMLSPSARAAEPSAAPSSSAPAPPPVDLFGRRR